MLSEADKIERRRAVAAMFDALGVKPLPTQERGWLNATALIPQRLFLAALAKLVREKADGYTTAPQPGECWQAARVLIPRSQWEHDHVTGSIPPKWFRQLERQNDRLMLSGWEKPAEIEAHV